MQPISLTPSRRSLEFGIYRDGDNNLDAMQERVIGQARATSAANHGIDFTVADTTSKRGDLATDTFRIDDGKTIGEQTHDALDMSDPRSLAAFVAKTLDNAQKTGAKQTWIDLVDHGAGDGGGLEADTFGGVMPMPEIAKAIAAGEAIHAQEHPEDAHRKIDGVVANQCLMASMGFVDALSTAGVKYLAASPETMLAPGTPTTVANAIEAHIDDPSAMAKGVVDTVMHTKYGDAVQSYGPAAAFDVLSLDHNKVATAEAAIKSFNDAAARVKGDTRAALREDVRSVEGMVRFPDATKDMPWHSDRPAVSLYDTIAQDTRLGSAVRSDAHAAADAVSSLILAHGESSDFAPFGASYRDAVGPTVHAPTTPSQIDPWAPRVSETDNAFYDKVDQAKFVHVVA